MNKQYKKQVSLAEKAIAAMQLKHQMNINYDYSSYELKHIAEEYLRVFTVRKQSKCYISNEAFVNTMWSLGFEYVYKNSKQSYFDVNSNEINKVINALRKHDLLLSHSKSEYLKRILDT